MANLFTASRWVRWQSVAFLATALVSIALFWTVFREMSSTIRPERMVQYRYRGIERVGNVPFSRIESIPSLQFINDREGWLANGPILWHTTDGGSTWIPLYGSGDTRSSNILEFGFPTPLIGWLVTTAGAFRTDDGGVSWSSLIIPFRKYPYHFVFLKDGQRGWAGGWTCETLPDEEAGQTAGDSRCNQATIGPGAIAKTSDGGKHWTLDRQRFGGGPVFSFKVVDDDQVWALSGNDVLHLVRGRWTTTDLLKAEQSSVRTTAASDRRTRSGDSLAPRSLEFADSATGWAPYSGGFLLKTLDGGRDWREISELKDVWPGPQYFSLAQFDRLCFSDRQSGWAVDGYQHLYQSDNGGAKWSESSQLKFKALACDNSGIAWAITDEGLYRLTTVGN